MILDIVQQKNSTDVEISYIDSEQKREILTIPKREFWKWKNTSSNSHPNLKSWDNKGVVKQYWKDTDYIDKISIWEWINSQTNGIKETLYEFNMPKILFCDIETEVIDGFPDVKTAKEKITAITVCWKDDNGDIQTVILGEKEKFDFKKQNQMSEFISDYFSNVTEMKIITRYLHCKTEVEMLERFVSICSKFHVITGWNFINTFRSNWMNDNGFDWPFLSKRMENINVDYSKISPIGVNIKNKDIGNIPAHFSVVDYMFYFDAFDRSIKVKEAKSLDYIAGEVLKVKKLKYGNYPEMNGEVLTEMFEQDYDKYCLYNAVDTILVLLIHEYRQPFSAILAQGNESCNPISKADSAVNVTEGFMNNEYLQVGGVMPLINKKNRKKEKYEGAYVKSPIRGMHEYNACYDFSSLYPSISRFLYLSFENYKYKCLGNLKTFQSYKDGNSKVERTSENEVISLTGCVFDKKNSVLKGLYDKLYASRKVNQHRSKICAKIAHELKESIK